MKIKTVKIQVIKEMEDPRGRHKRTIKAGRKITFMGEHADKDAKLFLDTKKAVQIDFKKEDGYSTKSQLEKAIEQGKPQ